MPFGMSLKPFFSKGIEMKKFLFLVISLFSLSWALAAVNINTASVQELQTLPNIGPAKAQAIVEYRTQNGGFKSIEEIQKVKGIGAATFEKMKADISVGGGAKPAAAKPAAAKPATK